MDRVPEPELMLASDQAEAYAEADFSQAHDFFVTLFARSFPNWDGSGNALDLGCGTADVTIRFSRAYQEVQILGVDGSEAMLKLGRRAIRAAGLEPRITLIERLLPTTDLPLPQYDAVISNSLLHHLGNPQVLWRMIRDFARPRGPVLVMDLRRPEDLEEARSLTQTYTAGAPAVLQRDFYNSLLAAYRVEEVREQLSKADLEGFEVESVSDRHLAIHGRFGH